MNPSTTFRSPPPNEPGGHAPAAPSGWRAAAAVCAAARRGVAGALIGHALGTATAVGFGLASASAVALSVGLASVLGLAFTMVPRHRETNSWADALFFALVADSVLIATFEVIAHLVMGAIPGALSEPLSSVVFWSALASSLAVALFAAPSANRWFLRRMLGPALVRHRRTTQGGKRTPALEGARR